MDEIPVGAEKKVDTAEFETEDFLNKQEHEKILDIVKKDDVTWKTIIQELINSNKMDPWNIDVKLLTKEYIKVINQLQEHDFRVSGKMILAAALLLKLKSTRLLEGDLNELDRLLASTQESEEEFDDLGLVDEILPEQYKDMEPQKLIPRMPKPRKRKVSIYDLVEALEKALEVKERRVMRRMPSLELEIPKKKRDISLLMNHLTEKINQIFVIDQKDKVFFTDLTPGPSKEEKIVTFIPLLHLTNARKIDLEQNEHFGPIEVQITKKLKDELQEELGSG